MDADGKDMLMYLRLENGANAIVLELDGAKHGTLETCFGRYLSCYCPDPARRLTSPQP